ncbi:DUF2207 family protein [Rugosimonospora africana]|uniref:Predicted membrane protein YciQ-like C-terminal domain-containing protein n=1 Tax=Rugosimonospora africana TaxID=556532 RepID=A0A8J3VUS0_9ACTN|nr:DUF2207 domain-containing protein [Rugosimonospora africana]GIH19887.1 hypothetical protein Raf01_80590 [Rugosimonospora africana]
MTTSQLAATGLAVASVGVWVAAYLVALLVTRPARPEPAPPTQDLGPEPPAVASLLAGGWVVTEDAGEATLIDLAARRYLEFRQPGNDPVQTTVHVRDPRPAGLNRYERMIFDRVCSLAVNGVVPLTALTFRDPAQATRFGRRVHAAVVADCRARGLSRRRFGPTELTVLNVLAVVCGFGVAVAVLLLTDHAKGGPSLKAAFAAWLFGAVLLAGFGNRSIGERDTPAGRAACARWLGVKTWLRNTEELASLPPAAVAVWDRYLAYGAALGAARTTSVVIDLGMGNRRRVWSSYGGRWQRVRVRYPRFWPRYGRQTRYFAIESVLLIVGGGLLIGLGTGSVTTVLGVLALCGGLYVLARAVVDATNPVTVTGQVLWCQKWRTKQESRDTRVPWLHYLAVHDGTGDTTTAWGLPSEWTGRCGAGDAVRMSVRRWSRRVVALDLVAHGPVPHQKEAGPVSVDTESLIAAELGVSTLRGAGGTPLPSAGLLLTADEVSRAVGVPVTMRGVGDPGSRRVAANMVRFEAPDGRTLVTLEMGDGTGGKLSMMFHRRNPPLPGIGDEAYGGDRWAVGRKGAVVVSVSARTNPFPVDPRNLYWLLSIAVSRLSLPTAPAPWAG